jgi:hypothetical protein
MLPKRPSPTLGRFFHHQGKGQARGAPHFPYETWQSVSQPPQRTDIRTRFPQRDIDPFTTHL